MSTMKKRCMTCKFWQGPIDPNSRYCPPEEVLREEFGYCKRHAPRPAVVPVDAARGKTYITIWPETTSGEICGDYVKLPLYKEE